jgi:hypothetical protein
MPFWGSAEGSKKGHFLGFFGYFEKWVFKGNCWNFLYKPGYDFFLRKNRKNVKNGQKTGSWWVIGTPPFWSKMAFFGFFGFFQHFYKFFRIAHKIFINLLNFFVKNLIKTSKKYFFWLAGGQMSVLGILELKYLYREEVDRAY